MNAEGTRVDEGLIDNIASRLDLREPNQDALRSVAYALSMHYDVDHIPPPFEGVVDVATGVGKTYIMAAVVEYYAALGHRNFAVITPGRTILNKTVDNLTAGHPKSLTGGMDVEPIVVTSENFDKPTTRAAMDDDSQVKLYVFTVQALIKPTTKAGRKTHEFREGLGAAFYEHLQNLDDLIVLADEHHTYYGNAFSKAVRDLDPYALIGLTATPHRLTPKDQIIYRYPLALAIADKLVKMPVIVGRRDDRTDVRTKLEDGARLIELKQQAVDAYRFSNEEVAPVNPVMLVVADKIEAADEVAAIVAADDFMGGRYADSVLTVHSEKADEALAALDTVEDPHSPVRIIVSVGMLKEGWDVKNVYVIASLRPSISDLLTEQTLGRGLRLPFSKYTGIEILDTVEIVAHERYEALLRKKDILKEELVDYRTRMALRTKADGTLVAVAETTEIKPVFQVTDGGAAFGKTPEGTVSGSFATVEDRMKKLEQATAKLQHELLPLDGRSIPVPHLKATPIKAQFSISDIIDENPFRELGRRHAANPEDELIRTVIRAERVDDESGISTTLFTSAAANHVKASRPTLNLKEAKKEMTDLVVGAEIVPARPGERLALGRLIDSYVDGLGDNAGQLLSVYMDRASKGFIDLITTEQRKYRAKPQMDEIVQVRDFAPVRIGKDETSKDTTGKFSRTIGYEGWAKSMYPQVWFDSSTERDLARIVEGADNIDFWVRLHTGDLPILWTSGGREYNPDFIVVDTDGNHWIVEVKADKEMTSGVVEEKREAAKRWANHVSDDGRAGIWRYLLVSESDIVTAKRSWEALKKLGA